MAFCGQYLKHRLKSVKNKRKAHFVICLVPVLRKTSWTLLVTSRLVCSLPVMRKKGERYWKRARVLLFLLSIHVNDKNNSCTALYPVRARVTLNSALMVVCTNWASSSDDTFVVSVARLWQCALYGRGENELGITTSMLVHLLKLIWTGCSSLVLFIPLLTGKWPTEQQKMDRNKQNFEEENQTFQ